MLSLLCWLFTECAQSPVTLNAAGRGEGGKSVSSLSAPGIHPLLISKTSWSWWLCKPFCGGSLCFSDCFSDVSHPSYVCLSSSGLVGLGLIEDDEQNGLCLGKVPRDHAANHPLHLLRLLLPPPSAFSALVQNQAPGPSSFALAKTLAGCLRLAIWRPFCLHCQVPALLCRVFWTGLPQFQLFQLMEEEDFSLCKTPKWSMALAPIGLTGQYPAASKAISLLCVSFLLPFW